MTAPNSTALTPRPEPPRFTVPAPIAWESEIRGATFLVKSGLCPSAIKTPEAALFVILAGRDLGLSPVASLRNISVIQGKIEVAADMQLALFHRAGGRSRWVTLTDQRADLELAAPWTEQPHVSTFTMEDAKRAGLAGDNWRKYPKAMLRSRAITQGLKDIGYDATAGVYAPGEIGGPEDGPAHDRPVGVTEDGEVMGEDVTPPPTRQGGQTPLTSHGYPDGEYAEGDPGSVRLPGGPTKWGGHGGKPLREVPTHALEAFAAWVGKQDDPSDTLVTAAEAASAELGQRQELDQPVGAEE